MSAPSPLAALVERWRARARAQRAAAINSGRASYMDGVCKGGALALEGAAAELEDVVMTERDVNAR